MAQNVKNKIVKELFDRGVDAVDDFLGYQHDVEEDPDVTVSRIEAVLDEAPDSDKVKDLMADISEEER